MTNFEEKAQALCGNVVRQFNSRIVSKMRNTGQQSKAGVSFEISDRTVWLSFSDHEANTQIISFPIPFVENGTILIDKGDTKRAMCPVYIKRIERELDFLDVVDTIIFGDPTGMVPDHLLKGVDFVQQLTNAIQWGTLSITIRNLQRAINEVINKMPLHKTYMNSWAMNQRLMIVDFGFDSLGNPKEKHEYQIAKNNTYFTRGWTSIGLSDGCLANKNYILKEDIRKYTPFGIKYHNPQRNLYSTLGMEGEELPLVRSESMQRLIDQGISRTGWNLFTVFVDIPDVWEDQLMVDSSLLNKYVEHTKKYQVFGTVLVNPGDTIKKGDHLAVSPDEIPEIFKLTVDKAWVEEVKPIKVSVGGISTEAFNITVRYRRNFKDGVKITNLAANKGIMRVKDLGYAVDPRTGETRKIEVIVSCKAVEKRKNYTQILEALINNLYGEEPVVFKDDIEVTKERLEERLLAAGLPKEGTWACNTYAGNFEAVAGKVFWGVTKDVEDAIWEPGDTTKVNGRGLRDAGLKFSTVEFRALETRFGKNNAIVDEVMSYMQGADDIHEMLRVIKSKCSEMPAECETIHFSKIKPADTTTASIVPESCIIGSVLDETYYPNGFILELPVQYMTWVAEGEEKYEGLPVEAEAGMETYLTDKIYIPNSNLRKCWRHSTGKLGLSEFGGLVNNVLELSHRYSADKNNSTLRTLLYNAIFMYFLRTANTMGSKRGELAVHGMSVRYPYSAKAVASLSNNLPKNTVELHSSMAKQLEVNNGDVVLVERFPCLGFTCLRPQKVKITEDPMCKFTIRASGNSLGSAGLDFDGDVLYIASFHSEAAKATLRKEWTNPNQSCYSFIQELNQKMGAPHHKEMTLQSYEITPFEKLTCERHADIVDKLTGVKSNTGPVIALAYNIMRIIENSRVSENQKTNCAVEVFLDKVANSIFKQKHGVKALSDIVVDAICTGDVESLVAEGFARGTSQIICDLIKEKAAEIGVHDLVAHYKHAQETGSSNVINVIIRKQHKVYFASRASLQGVALLKHLEHPAVDVPSKILKWVTSAHPCKTELEKRKEGNELNKIQDLNFREAADKLFKAIDVSFKLYGNDTSEDTLDTLDAHALVSMRESYKSILRDSHSYVKTITRRIA